MSKTRPTTKRAIAVIRDARGARRAKADALTLANQIIRTINSYGQRHPDATIEHTRQALATALTQVEGSE